MDKRFLIKHVKHYVIAHGKESTTFDTISGDPHRSNLFVIYINSLVEKSESSELFLYADDLEIFKEIKTDDVEALQQELDALYDWTRYPLLKFQRTNV